MPIDSKTVQGRRTLKFQTLADVVTDAEILVTSPDIRMLGNWPLNQLLTHLTTAINGSIDGVKAKVPWYARMIGPFIKGRILKRGMPAGFHLPKEVEPEFFPSGLSNQEAFEQMRTTVARLQSERMTSRHPILGQLTHDEWTQLHLRHAELHLSFAVPQ